MLNLHFFHYFAGPAKISEVVVGGLCVFAVVGLQRMRLWGRWLAIVLAGACVGYAIWFCSVVLIFSDVDVSSAPTVAVCKEHDRTRIRDLHFLVSRTTRSAARTPTATPICG
jgi:hypothetical protein